MNREFDGKIRKVGNSYVVTIPMSIINRFKLKDGSFITVNVEFTEEEKK